MSTQPAVPVPSFTGKGFAAPGQEAPTSSTLSAAKPMVTYGVTTGQPKAGAVPSPMPATRPATAAGSTAKTASAGAAASAAASAGQRPTVRQARPPTSTQQSASTTAPARKVQQQPQQQRPVTKMSGGPAAQALQKGGVGGTMMAQQAMQAKTLPAQGAAQFDPPAQIYAATLDTTATTNGFDSMETQQGMEEMPVNLGDDGYGAPLDGQPQTVFVQNEAVMYKAFSPQDIPDVMPQYQAYQQQAPVYQVDGLRPQPVQATEPVTLPSLSGHWQIVGTDGYWSVDGSGVAHFNGERHASLLGRSMYDIYEANGSLLRGDGWALDMTKSTPTRLQWMKKDEAPVVWVRAEGLPPSVLETNGTGPATVVTTKKSSRCLAGIGKMCSRSKSAEA